MSIFYREKEYNPIKKNVMIEPLENDMIISNISKCIDLIIFLDNRSLRVDGIYCILEDIINLTNKKEYVLSLLKSKIDELNNKDRLLYIIDKFNDSITQEIANELRSKNEIEKISKEKSSKDIKKKTTKEKSSKKDNKTTVKKSKKKEADK